MYPRDLPALVTAAPMPLAMPLAMPFMPREYANPGMSPTQLTSILWAWRKLTLLIAASVVLVAGAACALWPRTYEASASLMVNFEVNDPLGGKEFPTGLLGSYMATQVELARGSEVLLPVIDRLRLTRKEEYAAGYSGNPAGLRDWVETRVQKNLLVEQGRYGSQLIHLTYAARTPDEAARVANAVGEEYSQQQYRMLTGPATERARRSTEQLAELKSKVTKAQEQVTEFRQRSGLVDADARIDVDMHAALIQSLKTQLAAQTTRMAELAPTLGARHPQVLELQSQTSATRQQLQSELRAYSGKAAAELTGAKYQLELQSAQSSYARALDGYDQIKFASAGGYSNVNFVSRATPPPKASKPKVTVVMFLAFLAGGILGIAIPLIYELLHRRVRCRDDMERDHGIPVLVELGPIGAPRNQPALGAA